MESLPDFLSSNELYITSLLPTNRDADSDTNHNSPKLNRRIKTIYEPLKTGEEMLIGSRWMQGNHECHKVFLDIDVPHYYKPSRTEGHGHLMLNCNVATDELKVLTEILVKLGITGNGNYRQIIDDGQLFLRV